MKQTETKISTLVFTNYVHGGGGFAFCKEERVQAYVPVRCVNSHDLRPTDEFEGLIGHNLRGSEIAPLLVHQVLEIIDASDNETITAEVVPLHAEEPQDQTSFDLVPADDGISFDMPISELDELILESFLIDNNPRRMTFPEVFWAIVDADHKSLEKLSGEERKFYDRINARCKALHKGGDLCAAQIRQAEKSLCSRIFYALNINHL